MGKKLTKLDISEIQRLHASGMSTRDISTQFGVCTQTVRTYVSPSVECRSCGRKIPAGSHFCMFCGKKVISEKDMLLISLRKAITHTAGSMYADEISTALRNAIDYIDSHCTDEESGEE